MSDILIAYFSVTGTTAHAAKKLAEATGGDLFEIEPQIPYTQKDLNWMNPFSRSTREMKGKLPYPEIKNKNADIESHSCILLCFPIWWYIAPTIINRFLESYDFSGKKIVLFATSGGSGFGKTAEKLRGSITGNAKLIEGKLLNGNYSVEELRAFVEKFIDGEVIKIDGGYKLM